MKALIFGIGGQDGHYLHKLCEERGIECPAIRWDVSVMTDVGTAIAGWKPDFVFQLAADSNTQHGSPFPNHAAISTGTLNVLEACRKYAPRAKIFIAGSALARVSYGSLGDATIDAPASPYALARIHAALAARYYRRNHGLQTYVGYLYHHESPRRPLEQLSQLIARAARENTAIRLGFLDVVKEWTFAGDTVRAMLDLVSQDDVHETEIGSGVGHSVREYAEACAVAADLSPADFLSHVTEIPGFKPEYRHLVAPPSAPIFSLGWRPKVSFEALAAMMVSGKL